MTFEKSQLLGENFNRLDHEAIRSSKAKLIFLCTPNNPIGTTLQIEEIAAIARLTSALVVVDEAYIEYSKEPSCVRLIKEHPNVVVLRTLSKAWGLAGIRCGMTLAHPSVIEAMTLVQGPFAVSEHTQQMAAGCLEDHATILSQIEKTRAERTRVMMHLSSSRHVSRVFPSEANFVLVECHDAKATHERLIRERIMVDPAWHLVPNSIRISISRESTNGILLAQF